MTLCYDGTCKADFLIDMVAQRDQELSETRAEVEHLREWKEISGKANEMMVDNLREWKQRATAAEAARDAAVSERDELEAQLAIVLDAVCDTTGLVDLKIADEMRANLPSRVKALNDVVDAAVEWHYDNAPISTTADEKLYAAISDLTALDQPKEQE
jgi:hypothetical protein